jgi:putative nucleotidyltransferase with HDIG domain
MSILDTIAAKAGNLPALPQVAIKVMEQVRDPDTTIKSLEEVISTDQALVAKVLRIANSTFYGMRGEVSELRRALVILGFNTIRSIVLTASTEAMYRSKSSNFKERILWEHALAVGLASRTISREINFPAAEEAFTAGLLHDIGKVVLDNNQGEKYQQVIEQVYNEGSSFVEAEREVFGFDHTEVGSLVARNWTLANPLEEALRLHHNPEEAEVAPQLCAIVALANNMCLKLGIGPEKKPELDLASLPGFGLVGIDPGTLDAIAEKITASLEEEKAVFSL